MITTKSSGRALILGGGPVGLGAALELARFGIASTIVEQHAGVAWHPKTRNFNTRTMEIARGWGGEVYTRLRGIDTPPGWKSPIRFFDTIVGKQHGQIRSRGFEGPEEGISPAKPVMSSQDLLELILLDAARATGLVEVRFGARATRVLSGWQDGATEASIEVVNRETGQTEVLTADALVAADGSDSLVRGQLGIELHGEFGLNHFVNTYFYADIEKSLEDKQGVLLFVSNDDVRGVLQPLDAHGRWLCQIGVDPEDWTDERWDDEACRNWVRSAVGIPDLPVDVRSIGRWKMNATTAERFVAGRIVLCGDAAHQFPPTGGLGVNTGLQGMHNAMWKLALCISGVAGPELLRTYDTERRLPAETTVGQSMTNHRNVGRINRAQITGEDSGLDIDTIVKESRRYGNHLGVEFGPHYQSSAVVPDGTAPPEVKDDYSDYAPSATPGARAPHISLGRDGSMSTLDLFGAGFTVLTDASAGDWQDAAAAVAPALGTIVACYRVGDPGIEDPDGRFLAEYGLEAGGAVLVRPDGFVAARFSQAPADPRSLLEATLRAVLSLGETAAGSATPGVEAVSA